MPYKWAGVNGVITEAEYNVDVDRLTPEQTMDALISALELFGNEVISHIRDNNIDDVYNFDSTDLDGNTESYVACVRAMTPGGRDIPEEHRMQPGSQQINAIYDAVVLGEKAFLIGVYRRDDITIFCAWKANHSNAAASTGVSKQIKIQTIAKAIKEGFAQQPKGQNEYACAFRREFIYFYINNSSWLHDETVEKLNNHIQRAEVRFNTGYQSNFERNRIVFGAPGTGKSYMLKKHSEQLLLDTQGAYERVTFHPDYAYSHFVGTYKPIADDEGEIGYEFVPGPFMRVYVRALKNGMTSNPQPHLLLIEEINRSKMAAVFGDVFQLLDRDEDGVSEYEIHATEDIRNYLARELIGFPEDFDKIRIPDNMFIWATMNSADQGVFPMDTAFKRRWNFDYLDINNNENSILGEIVLGKEGHELKINWNKLRRAINNKLTEEYKVNEDKLMGPFFLSKKFIETNNGDIANPKKFIDAFKSKVIMYLYEDAAKQYRRKLFSNCSNIVYSSICNEFDTKGIYIFGPNFKDDYYDKVS